MRSVRIWMDRLLSLLFVEKCALCGEILKEGADTPLCPVCRIKWESGKKEICCSCGNISPDCRCMPGFIHREDSVICVAFYHPKRWNHPANRLIYRLKKGGNRAVTRFLAQELVVEIRRKLPEEMIADLVITSPPRRRESVRQYGTDHAKQLGKSVAAELGCSYQTLFERTRDGNAQKSMSADERLESAGTSYRLKKNTVVGMCVLLVDDVITTGATLAACGNLLKNAGSEIAAYAAVLKTGRE